MTWVLYRKLLRDVRTPLIAVSLLLFGFGGLWVRVTEQVTTQISPLLTLASQMQGFGPTFFQDLWGTYVDLRVPTDPVFENLLVE